eukprot:TRINITY_DN4776_c4_g3_i1.p1 TRINITY_DN4776_c4_g3~~TRINITY_DN4776_c4_g3_i1.p1  ORF type:complete len:576 (-),score=168.73 TRINITY_DN4776_c4_g3_i1:132-1859(-)
MGEAEENAPSPGSSAPPGPRGLSTEVMWQALKGVGLDANALGGGSSGSKQLEEPSGPGLVFAQSQNPAVPKAAPTPPAASGGGGELSSSAVAGGHTPESIRRLPPKLRQRLVQRGILKEEDVKMALEGGASAAAAPLRPSPGTPPDPSAPPARASPGTPPDPSSLPQFTVVPVVGAVGKAPPSSQQQAAAWAQAAAAASDGWARAMAMAKLPATGATVGAVAKAVPAKASAAPRATYSSAPVLNKRPAADEAGGAEKRQCTEEKGAPGTPPDPDSQQFISPAEQRAAAARAEGDQAPTWLYKDGAVSQAGQQAQQPATDASTVAANEEVVPTPPPTPAPPTGPPLPPGWVRVPSDDDFYYWNTATNEVSWEHPAEKKAEPEKAPVFTEEHKVLWTDLGKVIGRQGMNLKIIKASIGCTIHTPKQGGKGGKGKGKKGKDSKEEEKGKGKGKQEVRRGIGDGTQKLKDDDFATITITGDTAHKARGGKRTIEVMLGYGRSVERALGELGVEVKMPDLEEMTDGKSKNNSKDGIDPMDPASYSDAPVGNWGAGIKRPGQNRAGPGDPRDSKTANAERF